LLAAYQQRLHLELLLFIEKDERRAKCEIGQVVLMSEGQKGTNLLLAIA